MCSLGVVGENLTLTLIYQDKIDKAIYYDIHMIPGSVCEMRNVVLLTVAGQVTRGNKQNVVIVFLFVNCKT